MRKELSTLCLLFCLYNGSLDAPAPKSENFITLSRTLVTMKEKANQEQKNFP